MMLKSFSFRLEKKAFSASYLQTKHRKTFRPSIRADKTLQVPQKKILQLYRQHLTTWKNGNFFEVWMEKEVMGKEKEEEGDGRLVRRSLCRLTGTGISSLISKSYTPNFLSEPRG